MPLILLGLAITSYALAAVFYSKHLSRVFGLDPNGLTPAVKNCDGKDYVPTRTPIVFTHHFASIAAAGPILGPTLALIYGWGPAWLWIVLGRDILRGRA